MSGPCPYATLLATTYTRFILSTTLSAADDGRWSAWIDVLPGCAAWGYTKEEALVALQDGTQVFVECMLENGQPVPNEEIGPVGEAGEMRVAVAA